VSTEVGFSASILLLASWSLLASGGLLSDRIGRDAAVLVSFAAVTALVVATPPRSSTSPIRLRAAAAAFAAGFASYPAWAALIVAGGLAVGLAPRPGTPPGAGSPALWIAVLVLAPVFEELLYRERLIPALRERIGAPLAVVATSALFALPHLEPWNVLGTFLVGLMLGAVYLGTAAIELCIALHAGLNLGCVACGVPPVRLALSPSASALAGTLLLAASLVILHTGSAHRLGRARTSRSLEAAGG